MAARHTPPQKPERPYQSVEQKRRSIDKINTRITELNAFDPIAIQQENGDPQVKALEVSIDTALTFAFGQNTNEYTRYSRAAYLDRAPINMHIESSWRGYSAHNQNSLREAIQAISKAKAESLALLNQAVKALEEEVEDMQLSTATPRSIAEVSSHTDKLPYNIHVNGQNSHVNINSHDQSINTINIQYSEFDALANELRELRQALIAQAQSAQDHVTIGAIAAAELGAEEKDSSKIMKALSSLGTTGHWVLKVAKELGIAVASNIIAAHLE
ncbi:TPA: hypothetical protein JBI17_14185 [Legionella pneumophila]|nr:hypothetical protein [Legionella pneumophila]HAU2265437.1 hypothetical protein [Legionella pneumophila]